jgi:hypothetical protein
MKPQSSSGTKGVMWTRSYDVFLAHIRMRKIQSDWYRYLYQTSRIPLENPYSYIWQKYHEMSQWFETLPKSTPAGVRDFFELDLLCSHVYILASSPACPYPSEHAQRLIIEHCTRYTKLIRKILSDTVTNKTPSLFSFYDALRCYMMGRDFVDNLSANFDLLLLPSPHSPSQYAAQGHPEAEIDPHSTSTPISAPSLPTHEYQDNSYSPISQAMETIESFLFILNSFSLRFGVSGISWHNKFLSEATPILTQLQARLATRSPSDPFLWQTSPVSTGSATTLMGTSPLRQSSMSAGMFYPSPPPSSQLSPPQYHAAPAPMPAGQDAVGGTGQVWYAGNEFGIDNLAAWKTLPGGPMNARFS